MKKIELSEEDKKAMRKNIKRGYSMVGPSEMSPKVIGELKQKQIEETQKKIEERKEQTEKAEELKRKKLGKIQEIRQKTREKGDEKVKKGFPWLRMLIILAIVFALYYYFILNK